MWWKHNDDLVSLWPAVSYYYLEPNGDLELNSDRICGDDDSKVNSGRIHVTWNLVVTWLGCEMGVIFITP